MILKMKRITLIAHKSDEAAILQALQGTGAVEVIAGDEPRAENTGLFDAEERVQKLSSALALMRPYAKKRGMLSPDPEGTLAQIQATVSGALQGLGQRGVAQAVLAVERSTRSRQDVEHVHVVLPVAGKR